MVEVVSTGDGDGRPAPMSERIGDRANERALAMQYAPPSLRPAIEALFALDDTLAAILRTTREPIVGQMRLTWWYEALRRLDDAPAPAEPVLSALQHSVLPCGVTGAMLATLTDGWEALLEQDLDAAAIDRFARDRGGRLFAFAGMVLGVSDARLGLAGEGWALADLSRRLSDADARRTAASRAKTLLGDALRGRWPSNGRVLGALALAARFDVSGPVVSGPVVPPGSPKRVGRMLLHRLTGY